MISKSMDQKYWTPAGSLSPRGKALSRKADAFFKRVFRSARTGDQVIEMESVLIHAMRWPSTRRKMDLQCRAAGCRPRGKR